MSMFDLEENRVHAIISKMMFSKRLLGSWDQTTRSIVLLKAEPSKLQHLAQTLAGKVEYFVETNERLLDQVRVIH
jgi:translation initiation factor 3 subunit C